MEFLCGNYKCDSNETRIALRLFLNQVLELILKESSHLFNNRRKKKSVMDHFQLLNSFNIIVLSRILKEQCINEHVQNNFPRSPRQTRMFQMNRRNNLPRNIQPASTHNARPARRRPRRNSVIRISSDKRNTRSSQFYGPLIKGSELTAFIRLTPTSTIKQRATSFRHSVLIDQASEVRYSSR